MVNHYCWQGVLDILNSFVGRSRVLDIFYSRIYVFIMMDISRVSRKGYFSRIHVSRRRRRRYVNELWLKISKYLHIEIRSMFQLRLMVSFLYPSKENCTVTVSISSTQRLWEGLGEGGLLNRPSMLAVREWGRVERGGVVCRSAFKKKWLVVLRGGGGWGRGG